MRIKEYGESCSAFDSPSEIVASIGLLRLHHAVHAYMLHARFSR